MAAVRREGDVMDAPGHFPFVQYPVGFCLPNHDLAIQPSGREFLAVTGKSYGGWIGRRLETFFQLRLSWLMSTNPNVLLSIKPASVLPSGEKANAVFSDPSSGTQTQIGNLTVAANTIIIFVGGQLLGGGEGGFGGPGGFNASGDQAWLNIVEGRGKPGALGSAAQQTAFAPWGAP